MPSADEREGIQGYAAGAFATPSEAGTVSVDGLGFEPDLLLFTATNAASVDASTVARRSGGWSHGAAVRAQDGFAQHVVSVADDDRRTDAGVSATYWDKAINLLVHGDNTIGSMAGAVTATTEDGFEVTFNDSTLPPGADRRYAVHYRGFETEDQADVQVGHFPTSEEPRTQTVPLGTDADYVSLTGSTVPTSVNAAVTTDEAVGIWRGQAVAYPRDPADQPRVSAGQQDAIRREGSALERDAVREGAAVREEALLGGTRARSNFDIIDQHAAVTIVATDAASPDVRGVYDDRALHLPVQPSGTERRWTIARVTDLGEELELTYDRVAGVEETDRSRLVTFVAVNAGDRRRPALGEVRAPVPGAAKDVDIGFEPGLLDVTAIRIRNVARDERFLDALPFDYSCGVAMPGYEGAVSQQALHPSLAAGPRPAPHPSLGAIDPFRMGRATGGGRVDETDVGADSSDDGGSDGNAANGDDETPGVHPGAQYGSGATASTYGRAAVSHGGAARPRPVEYDMLVPPGEKPPAVALALARDSAGGITGRDEIAVAAFDESGVRFATDGPESGHRSLSTELPPILLYTAWPSTEGVAPPAEGTGALEAVDPGAQMADPVDIHDAISGTGLGRAGGATVDDLTSDGSTGEDE